MFKIWSILTAKAGGFKNIFILTLIQWNLRLCAYISSIIGYIFSQFFPCMIVSSHVSFLSFIQKVIESFLWLHGDYALYIFK